MTEFRLSKHSYISRRTIVEIWESDRLIGCIYPADGAVRIVSKHLTDDCVPCPPLERPPVSDIVSLDRGPSSGFTPPALTVQIVRPR